MDAFLDDLDTSMGKIKDTDIDPAKPLREMSSEAPSSESYREQDQSSDMQSDSSSAGQSFGDEASTGMSSSGLSDMSSPPSSTSVAPTASAPKVVPDRRMLAINDPSDGWLNIRKGPGTKYGVIKKLDNGIVVEELRRSGRWVQIRIADGQVGWGYLPYMSVVSR